jgi:hypothetical protein
MRYSIWLLAALLAAIGVLTALQMGLALWFHRQAAASASASIAVRSAHICTGCATSMGKFSLALGPSGRDAGRKGGPKWEVATQEPPFAKNL